MRLNLLIISLTLILQSCSLTKHVPKGQSLLVENNIVIQANEDQKSLITKSEINDVIKQKPNGNIFGFIPFHLSIYNLSDTLNKNWLHKYLRKIGEEPVIVNTDLTKKSSVQIERLLAQKGYFNSIIQNSIETENKKSKINYTVFLGNTYSIQQINYPLFKDEKINKKINNRENSLIKKGDILNAGKLDEERNRINEILQNHGFFNSKRENIYFKHKKLKILGFKDNKYILNFLKKVSISVIPSKWDEPFGRTSLEAASRGSAVIISNKGGLPETSEAAIILKKVDKKNLFIELENLITNKKLLRRKYHYIFRAKI